MNKVESCCIPGNIAVIEQFTIADEALRQYVVYTYYDEAEEPLYIGCSKDFYNAHHLNLDKHVFADEIKYVGFFFLDNEADMKDAKKHLIKARQPKYNQRIYKDTPLLPGLDPSCDHLVVYADQMMKRWREWLGQEENGKCEDCPYGAATLDFIKEKKKTMILGAYIPKADTPAEKADTEMGKAFSEWLGYRPIRCFPANTLKELFKYSFLDTGYYPEEIVIFEADDYKLVDNVRWSEVYYGYTQTGEYDGELFERCFDIKDPKYCEYLVKEIPEDRILFRYNVHDMIYNVNYIGRLKGTQEDQMSALMNNLKFAAQRYVEGAVQNLSKPGSSRQEKEVVRCAMEKLAFQLYLAPIVIGTKLPKQGFEDFLDYHLDLVGQNFPYFSNILTMNNGNIGKPSYELFDKAFELMDECFIPTAPWAGRKIGPNEPCPCGSGKKYKKCCKGKYYER